MNHNKRLCTFDSKSISCLNAGEVLYYIKEFFQAVFKRLDSIEGDNLTTPLTDSLRIARFSSNANLPVEGIEGTIYLVGTNSADSILRYWYNGQYVNASSRVDLPNALSTTDTDFYAKFTDVDLSKYTTEFRKIVVLRDSNEGGKVGYYLYDGLELNPYLLL